MNVKTHPSSFIDSQYDDDIENSPVFSPVLLKPVSIKLDTVVGATGGENYKLKYKYLYIWVFMCIYM